MKILAPVVTVCLVAVLAVFLIKRGPMASAPPSPGADTKSSTRQPPDGQRPRNPYADGKWRFGAPASDAERSYLEADGEEAKLAVLGKLQASDPGSLAPLLRRALREPSEELRAQAVLMTPSLLSSPDDAADVLAAASFDESPEVRNHALEMTNEQAAETRLGVYSETIASPFPEVRETTVLELGRVRSKASLAILMRALDDGDPAFVARVNDELGGMIGNRFESAGEAEQWWESNGEKFDDRLIRMVD